MIVVLLAGCAADREQKMAEDAVARYHKLYNEQNYEEIFNSAHEEARRTKSKEGLGYVLAQSFERYGRHLGSELALTKISPIAGSEDKQVELAYRSKFERGERIETFLIVTGKESGALHSIGEISEEELLKLKSK